MIQPLAPTTVGTESSRTLRSELPGRYWVDSIYLDHLPELAHDNTGGAPLCFVVHYLPSPARVLAAVERVMAF